MSLRINFASFLKSIGLLRYRNNISRRKWHQGWSRVHPLIKRNGNLVFTQRTARQVVSTFSHNFDIKNETQTVKYIDNIKEGSFSEDALKTALILVRILIIGSIITIVFAAYLITRLTCTNLFPTILRKGIELLGPIFIKFGQWISTRRDIFPPDICDTLTELQQNVTPHSWQYTKYLLKATYGTSWRDLFVTIDEKLIGSGCCAQVYKAWIDLNATVAVERKPRLSCLVENKAADESDKLTSDSPCARKLQPVAVKVLHPGIKGQLKRDIAIMRGLCKFVTYFMPELNWLSLTDCIDEFAHIMENQVDMQLEAANLVKFSTNFSRRNDIIFPYPYTHLTHHGILVESFHDGSPISDYLKHDDVALQRKLAKMGIETILKMIFTDNFIHCDLHPGNILVEKAVVPQAGLFNTFQRVITLNYVANGPRLIILDCGLVVSLNDRCRRNLRDVFYSVLIGNAEMAAQYILEHNSHRNPDIDGFKRSMKIIMKRYRRNSCNVNVNTVVTDLFSAMIRHRVKQDGSFSNVILSMLVIEGLGRRLDPNIDIFKEMLPFIVSNAI